MAKNNYLLAITNYQPPRYDKYLSELDISENTTNAVRANN
jgi:hypothetical protein